MIDRCQYGGADQEQCPQEIATLERHGRGSGGAKV
jgi:hypothetical protein